MLSIRAAQVADVRLMLAMLRESAIDQGFPNEVVVTADDLAQDGFGPNPRFQAVIAAIDGTPAGMALFFINYSTWVSRLGVYLEDLYVRREFRRMSVGRELLTHVAKIAVSQGCGRFQWMVHGDNRRATHFYESFGAHAVRDWVLMSITGTELAVVAQDTSSKGSE